MNKSISGKVKDRDKLEDYRLSIYKKLQSWYHLSEEEAKEKMKKYRNKLGYLYNCNFEDYKAAQYIVWNSKVYKNYRQYKRYLIESLIKINNYSKKEAIKELKYYSEDDIYYYFSRNLHYSALASGIASNLL